MSNKDLEEIFTRTKMEYDNLQKKYSDLEKENKVLKEKLEKIGNLDEKLKKVKDKIENEGNLNKEKENQLKDLENKLEEKEKELKEFESKLKEKENQLDIKSKEYDNKENDLNDDKEDSLIKEIENKRKEKKNEAIFKLNEEITNLEQEKTKKIEEIHNLEKEKIKKIEDINNEIKSINENYEKEIEEKEKLIKEKTDILDKREKEVEEKERNILNGKINLSNAHLDELNNRIGKLNEELLNLEKEKTKRIEDINNEIKTISENNKKENEEKEKLIKERIDSLDERESNIKKMEKDFFDNRKSIEKKAISEEREKYKEEEKTLNERIIILRDEIVNLENDKNSKLKETDKYVKRIIKEAEDYLEEKRNALEIREKSAADAERSKEESILSKNKYESLCESIEDRIENEAQSRCDKYTIDKDNRIKELECSISNLNESNLKLTNELERYENAERESGGKSKEELNGVIKRLRDDNALLRDKLANMPDEIEYEKMKDKAFKYDDLYSSYIEIEKEYQKLKDEYNRKEYNSKYYAAQVAQVQNELDLKTLEYEGISSVLEKYKSELDKIKKTYENVEDKENRIRNIKSSIQFTERKIEMPEPEIEEIDWINNIYKKCKKSDIVFSERLLYAFHTALKSSEMSPLTILSGVSGTGKSELPRLYSRFGGMYFISLPVQPDWDSPQSLFGFFNSLDNKYNSTSLLRAMIQFASNNNEEDRSKNFNDAVLLVLLDEMNLAHIELYFSDLLSKFESRRGNNNIEYIDVDLGTGYTYPIAVGDNILWTGTMNEDETTKSLSDKVIDRGYQINFSVPEELYSRDKFELLDEEKELKFKVWKKWIDSNKIIGDNDRFKEYKKIIEEINAHLDGTGRAMGHRIWQSIEIYIRRHPLNYFYYSKLSNENNEKNKSLYEKALGLSFEESLVYKVMPKLRGMELGSDITKKALLNIQNIINDKAKGLIEDYDTAMNTPDEQFIWRSAKYLENSETKDLYKNILDNNEEAKNRN